MRSQLVLALLIGAAVRADPAAAQSRIVIVNGQLLSDASLAKLEQTHCARIPEGSYWLNLQNGAWGYAGNPQVQGRLGDPCRAAATAPNRDGTHGPYATMRRAEEVANGYRAQGLRAVAFHNGDGYYVRVSR